MKVRSAAFLEFNEPEVLYGSVPPPEAHEHVTQVSLDQLAVIRKVGWIRESHNATKFYRRVVGHKR
jgi:hypothetical protein